MRRNNIAPANHEKIPESELSIIKGKVDGVINDWVNYPSLGEEGFYPLHFASFHGNIKLIKLFVSCGANINARNK